MTALAQDRLARNFLDGHPRKQVRGGGTLATAKVLYLGAVTILVDGVEYPLVAGSAMAALCQLVAGADANGGVYVASRQPGVRFKMTSGAAEAITVVPNGATTDIDCTYNNGTSTAATVVQLIRRHGEADRLLRTKFQGTGASSPAAQAFTAVPHIVLGGVVTVRMGDAASVAAQTIPLGYQSRDQGVYGMLGDGSAPPTLINGECYLLDDQTVIKTADPLAIKAQLLQIKSGAYGTLYFVSLAEAN